MLKPLCSHATPATQIHQRKPLPLPATTNTPTHPPVHAAWSTMLTPVLLLLRPSPLVPSCSCSPLLASTTRWWWAPSMHWDRPTHPVTLWPTLGHGVRVGRVRGNTCVFTEGRQGGQTMLSQVCSALSFLGFTPSRVGFCDWTTVQLTAVCLVQYMLHNLVANTTNTMTQHPGPTTPHLARQGHRVAS